MEKGKKYPYMNRKKQVNAYMDNKIWESVKKHLYPNEKNTEFLKRAIINEIGKRIKLKMLYGEDIFYLLDEASS